MHYRIITLAIFSCMFSQANGLSPFVPSGSCPLFGNTTSIFSQQNQTIAPQTPVLFEETHFSSAAMDLSRVPETGEIRIEKSGIYRIAWRVECFKDLNVGCSFGLAVDEKILLNSIVVEILEGSTILHSISGESFITLNAGQTLQLMNMSRDSIRLLSQFDNFLFSSAVLHADLLVAF